MSHTDKYSNEALRERIRILEGLILPVKQSIRSVTIKEANDALGALILALMKVEPDYFISKEEWLSSHKFNDMPETD